MVRLSGVCGLRGRSRLAAIPRLVLDGPDSIAHVNNLPPKAVRRFPEGPECAEGYRTGGSEAGAGRPDSTGGVGLVQLVRQR